MLHRRAWGRRAEAVPVIFPFFSLSQHWVLSAGMEPQHMASAHFLSSTLSLHTQHPIANPSSIIPQHCTAPPAAFTPPGGQSVSPAPCSMPPCTTPPGDAPPLQPAGLGAVHWVMGCSPRFPLSRPSLASHISSIPSLPLSVPSSSHSQLSSVLLLARLLPTEKKPTSELSKQKNRPKKKMENVHMQNKSGKPLAP